MGPLRQRTRIALVVKVRFSHSRPRQLWLSLATLSPMKRSRAHSFWMCKKVSVAISDPLLSPNFTATERTQRLLLRQGFRLRLHFFDFRFLGDPVVQVTASPSGLQDLGCVRSQVALQNYERPLTK
jgi:hypothetical protein